MKLNRPMVNQELKSTFSKELGAVLHSPKNEKRCQLDQYNASVCFKMQRRLISPAAGQFGLWVLLGTCEGERLEEGLELRQKQGPSPHTWSAYS